MSTPSFHRYWFINLKVPGSVVVRPTAYNKEEKQGWSTGKRPETSEPQRPISGNNNVKLYPADSHREALKFLPFSGAGCGAIFPAAAFFRPLALGDVSSCRGWTELRSDRCSAGPLARAWAGEQRHRVDERRTTATKPAEINMSRW